MYGGGGQDRDLGGSLSLRDVRPCSLHGILASAMFPVYRYGSSPAPHTLAPSIFPFSIAFLTFNFSDFSS